MKTIIFIVAVLAWANTYGQISKVKGTWVSGASDVIVIDSSANKYGSKLCTASKHETMELYFSGDTLKFQKHYYSSAIDFKKLYVNNYDLVITKLTDSTLTLEPSSPLSKRFFGNRSSINFIRQELNIDNSIAFEKIIYHSTTCYGSCPIIGAEITNKKNIYLEGQFFKNNLMYQIDSLKSGQFVGQLSDSLYNEFLTILKSINLKTLDYPERLCCDAPVTTLIIYYNGERKYLKSMFPPEIATRLIRFLRHLNEKVVLTRTNTKRILEK